MFKSITKKTLTILLSIVILIILGSFFVAQNTKAAINKQFNYQGKLTDTSGVAIVDGAYDVVLKLYTVAGGGSASWTESWTNAALWTETSSTTVEKDHADCGGAGYTKITYVTTTNESTLAAEQAIWNTTKKESAVIKSATPASDYICIYNSYTDWISTDDLTNRIYVKDGLFSAMAGTITAQTVDFIAATYYLGVTIGTDSEMIPRKRIGAVPQAWNANNVVGDGYVDIDTTSISQDAVNISYNPASGTYDALEITYGSGGGTGVALNLTQSGTGNSLSIDQNGNVGTTITTDGALFVENTGNTGIGLNTYTNIGATSDAGLAYFIADNTGFDQTVLTIQQDGTGDILNILDGTVSVFKISDGGNITASEINNIIYVDGTKYTQDSPGIQEALDDLPSTGGKVILPEGTYNVDRAMDTCIADDGGSMTDQTTECNNATANNITLLPATPAVNDAYYFGYDYQTRKVSVNIGTQGAGTWTITWEYYNGAWTALSGVTDGTIGFTAAAGEEDVTYTLPTDWAKTTVNSTEKYYIRARVSAYTSITTQPLGTQAYGTGSITIDKSYVTLEGVGDSSKLYLSDGANVTVISTSSSGTNISSLYIDCNNGNNSGGSGVYLSSNATFSIVQEIYVKDVRGTSISNFGSSNKIINNKINLTGIHGNGISIEASKCIVMGNSIISSQGYQHGISFWNADNNVISSNYISGFGDGIWLYSGSDNNSISNNSISGSSGEGIFIVSSNNNAITGNSIYNSSDNGINIDTSSYNTISSNVLENNTSVEIYLNDTSTYNIVDGNNIKTDIAYGIQELATADDYNTITNNTIIGATTSAISVLGANTIVSGNKTDTAGEGLHQISTSTNATSTALTVTQNGTGNIIDLKYSSTSLFTLVSEDRLKLEGNLLTSIGAFNDNIIDDMESAEAAEWVESDTGNTDTVTETTKIKVNDGAMKITTTASSSNTDYLRKTISSEDWSSADRIGFWIQGTVAGQIVSIQFYDSGAVTSDYNITISSANEWRYEEWDISGITSTSRDDVDWIQFIIDDDTSSPTFYIDQLRRYNASSATNRMAEFFLDADGSLVMFGDQGVEIGRTSPGSSLPSIKVGGANVQINNPLQINVPGNTGMSYDLNFLNTGTTQITSEGPLIISAGDANHNENLTITTGSNSVSGDSGISTAGAATTITDSTKAWTADE
ncbi:MAG: right-handed parallel beta-helix repeat-containing protein, partial [Candidatus Pacebacteria bacterium]|nr:right-handed parallel beta-helix repeat-containing protein [Candidatus Paceibacterota bacterium]